MASEASKAKQKEYFRRKYAARKRVNYNDLSSAFDKLFLTKLESFRNEGTSDEWIKVQENIFKENIDVHRVNKEDIIYWENFVKLIDKKREESEDGKVYWRNEYVDEIGLPETPKLVFVKGGKNIGKTYAISQYLTRRLAENPKSQVMLVRTTRMELVNGLQNQLLGEEWPFTLKISNQKLIRKEGYLAERGESEGKEKRSKYGSTKRANNLDIEIDQDEILEPVKDTKDLPDHCGWATYATSTGFRAFQGGGYKYLTDVIWDELNDTGQLTEALLTNFLTFLLSMERNNKNLRVWLYGNLLRRDDGSAADLALDFFRIPYDCNLKFFRTKRGTPCLYINTGAAGELFDGTDEQTYTDIYGIEKARDLNSNMPTVVSKVLNIGSFLNAVPLYSFITEFEEKYVIVYIGQIVTSLNETFYILHLEKYTPLYHYPGYYPITDSVEAVNLFNAVSFKKAKKVAKLIKKIRKWQQKKRLFFSNDEVRLNWCSKIAGRLVRKYNKELDGDL